MVFIRSVLILVSLTAPAFGQARTEARTSIVGNVTLPAYRLTRTDGSVILIVSYVKKGLFYVVTDMRQHSTQHLIESVKSIEPLSQEEMDKASADLDQPSAVAPEYSARTSPRIEARTTARRTGRRYARKDGIKLPPSIPVESNSTSAASLGTTATGIPLHMGPRGGIYHYSANGNKVYERHR